MRGASKGCGDGLERARTLRPGVPDVDPSTGFTQHEILPDATRTYGEDYKTYFFTGKINGAIKNSDLRSTVLPGVAAALTAILADASAEATTKTAIKSLLDKGNCGTATANDNVIDTCEVSDGALKSALTPDLDLYSDTTDRKSVV